MVYPLVNIYIAMERSTILNGKTHYKSPFSIAMLVITRGYIYKITIKSPLKPIKSPLKPIVKGASATRGDHSFRKFPFV